MVYSKPNVAVAMQIMKHFRKNDSVKRNRSISRSRIFGLVIAGMLWDTPLLVLGQPVQVAELHAGKIVGTVTDLNHDTVPDAMVVLEGPTGSDRQSVVSNDNGYFEFHDLKPGMPYQVSISANGFGDWHSSTLMLAPSDFKILRDIELRIEVERTTINVAYDPVRFATEQVKIEEQQRIFGFIPSYYVVLRSTPRTLDGKIEISARLQGGH